MFGVGSTSDEVVEGLRSDLKEERERFRTAWKLNCEQVAEQDALLTAKEGEIEIFRHQLEDLRGGKGDHAATEISTTVLTPLDPLSLVSKQQEPCLWIYPWGRQGVARSHPSYHFSSESFDMQLDNWLPSLERASLWNGWSDGDKLLQLAGHLRGRAL